MTDAEGNYVLERLAFPDVTLAPVRHRFLKTDAQTKAAIEAIEDAGYTVKYKFYRSVKKSAA